MMKIEDRMRLSVRRRAGQVVLRAELSRLGSASQVSSALKALQKKGELVRLGAGVYAKAAREPGTGEVRPLADFGVLAREAADKLHMLVNPNATRSRSEVSATQNAGQIVVFDTGHRRVSRKLALGSHRVVYTNDRMRAVARFSRVPGGRLPLIPNTGVAQFVRALARVSQVKFIRTPLDEWAETATQLAGDDIRSGPVQDLLVALKRAGVISSDELAALLINFLRDRKQSVRSV